MRIVPRFTLRKLLLERDYAECSCQIIIRTGGVEKVIAGPVGCRPATKLNSPKLVAVNRLAVGVLVGAPELPRYAVEGVDGPGVFVVREQQRVAQCSNSPVGGGTA